MIEEAKLIAEIGFPSGAFILMWVLVRDSMRKLTSAVENNTRAIVRLCEKQKKR